MRQLMKEAFLPVGIAIALAFVIQGALAKPYEIPTGSMIPTIQERDRIVANRFVYHLREPQRGDIVVFNPTDDARQSCGGQTTGDVPFVKRLIGLPGDRVQVRDNVAFVNGRRFDVPGAITSDDNPDDDDNPDFPVDPDEGPVRVPPGKLFFLGDNRVGSCDARSWRAGGTGAPRPFVDRDEVIGQAEATYWPPRHIGFLD